MATAACVESADRIASVFGRELVGAALVSESESTPMVRPT